MFLAYHHLKDKELKRANLLHYATMIAWTYPLRYFAGWPYEAAIDTTLIGSSSHFEAAIAVATTLYGIGLTIKFLSLNRSFMKLLEGSFMWKRSFMEKYGV